MLSRLPLRRRPALLLAVSLAIGIGLVELCGVGWTFLLLLIPLAAMLLLRFLFPPARLNSLLVVGAVLTVSAATGTIRVGLIDRRAGASHDSAAAQMADGRVQSEFFGRVAAIPVRQTRGWEVIIDLRAARTPTGRIPLRARARWRNMSENVALNYGDYVRFEGHLEHPAGPHNPGGFDYARYLKYRGIDVIARVERNLTRLPDPERHVFHNDVVHRSREWVRGALVTHLDPAARAVILGLLLGDTDAMPESVLAAFRNSGTLHLLAVSGSNVWLWVALLSLVLSAVRIRGGVRFVILLVGIFFFSFLTRNEPSVVRASIMATLVLYARWRNRPIDLLNIMGAAAVLILLVRPYHLFLPGFQLSFAAVAGIGAGMPRIWRLLSSWQKTFTRWRTPEAIGAAIDWVIAQLPKEGGPLARFHGIRVVWKPLQWLAAVVFLSFFAAAATAPILAWQFGRVPTLGTLANIPLGFLAMAGSYLGIVLLFVSSITPALAPLAAWSTEVVARASVNTAAFFARQPGALWDWSDPSVLALSVYAALVFVFLFPRRRYRIMRPCAAWIGVLVLVAVWRPIVASDREEAVGLTVSCLSMSHERGAVVRFGSGEYRWIVPADGFAQETRRWVIDPFCRSRGIPQESLEAGRSFVDLPTVPSGGEYGTAVPIVWEQWYGASGRLPSRDGAGVPQAHRLIVGADTLVYLLSWPRYGDDLPESEDLAASCDILILPLRGARPRAVRRWIERADPAILVMDGRPRRNSRRDWLDLWRARYPDLRVLAPAAQGTVDLHLTGRGVLATAFRDGTGS